MNKIVLGLLLGLVLGALDGLTALASGSDEVKKEIVTIVIGSSFKGLVAGALAGWFARRVDSIALGVLFGFVVALGFAYAIAAMPAADGKHYYLEIMLPGSIVGAIVGFATQKYGRRSASSAR